ncbi:serine-rich adhesin for platelets [Uranotaenia lowii]|uniref:serine-rich adhesin for platelets n=1 Tax=Uranotaenia lowii TaxID=190385 RepID=UPI002479D1E7|nr:serine-rich adhesin for platelets [Uranotaenia lowii]
MLSGRLRRRALALLGALLLVIFLWPPCCATMPKPLPAVLPNIPPPVVVDRSSELAAIVVSANPVQPSSSSASNKSRKMSDLNRFMNILVGGRAPSDGEGYGESGKHSVKNAANDDRNRALKLNRPENSGDAVNALPHSAEEPIDKNKSTMQVVAVDRPAAQPLLDNSAARLTRYQQQPMITNSPTIFSILSQRVAAASSPQTSSIIAHSEKPSAASIVDPTNRVNDRDVNRNVVNQSVFFNPLQATPSPSSSSSTLPSSSDDPHPSPHRRRVRSAPHHDLPQHHHRHQHHLPMTGEGTLWAGRGRGRLLHQQQKHLQHQLSSSHNSHHQQQQLRNTTVGGSSNNNNDSSNLERNERSANLSHITGANRKIQLYIKNRYLQLLADGTVNGTYDDQSDYTILQRTTVAAGQIRIQGVATCLFLCMDTCGSVYGSKTFTDDCVFNEQMEQHHYNTYSSTRHSNNRRTLYLALNKTGQPRKIQIPVNRTLGKLATYTKALTQTVAHDRVEQVVSRLFGADHVRHGLKQLCEAGRALQELTDPELKPRPACGASPGKNVALMGGTGVGSTGSAAVVPGGVNKDKDNKETLRKKKKKRRKCREDEPAGEHCFRPSGGSSGSSLGTNSGSSSSSVGNGTSISRKRPVGSAKSQRCSLEENDCSVSVSSSGSNSSGVSPTSANSISISSNSSSGSSRQATVPVNLPNATSAGTSAGSAGSKKKATKKVNNKNTPSNVHSNNAGSKKPKKGPGGGGGAQNANKKTKQLQSSSSSGSSINSNASNVSVPSNLNRLGANGARAKSKSTTPRVTPTTTTTPAPTTLSSTTPANLDDTSQADEADLLMDGDILDMDDLHQVSSAEIIEEDELDEAVTSALELTQTSAWLWEDEPTRSSASANSSALSNAFPARSAAIVRSNASNVVTDRHDANCCSGGSPIGAEPSRIRPKHGTLITLLGLFNVSSSSWMLLFGSGLVSTLFNVLRLPYL